MSSRVTAIHRTRIEQLLTEAESLSGTMLKIAEQCREVLAKGGHLQVQPQFAFATGSMARMLKDVGVVEQLQADGVGQRRMMQQ